MAKYEVTHSCGHTQTHNITGPDTRPYKPGGLTRREWIAAQRAQELCADCKAAARDNQRVTDTLAAVDHAAECGLPVLTGTEKQTAWAERIRRELISEFDALEAKSPAEHADITAGIRQVLTGALARQTRASWWIDNRGHMLGVNGALTKTLTAEENHAIDAFEDLLRTRLSLKGETR
jgi:hypothetical protein